MLLRCSHAQSKVMKSPFLASRLSSVATRYFLHDGERSKGRFSPVVPLSLLGDHWLSARCPDQRNLISLTATTTFWSPRLREFD